MTSQSECGIESQERSYRNSQVSSFIILEPGAEFNVLDLSEHILCAAHTSKLVFWDLRKMKQRAEFNDSFNG